MEYIHSRHLIHRDLKPENILYGLHRYSDTLHIIDFGLAKQYRDPHTHIHTKYRTDVSPIGTARYASINAQSGFELSRRDDLESLAYILIYFLRGSLPWQDLPGSTKMKHELMLQMKTTITPHVLCEGLPVEFELILNHARKLKFEQGPDYRYLHGLVRELLSKQESSTTDWEVANRLRESTTMLAGDEPEHLTTPPPSPEAHHEPPSSTIVSRSTRAIGRQKVKCSSKHLSRLQRYGYLLLHCFFFFAKLYRFQATTPEIH